MSTNEARQLRVAVGTSARRHLEEVDRTVARGHRLLRLGLSLLWIIAGLLQMEPDMFTTDFYKFYPSNIMPSYLQQLASDQPSWLGAVIHWGSVAWGHAPVMFNWFVIALQCGIGLSLGLARSRRFTRAVLILSIGWSCVVWVFGEGLGNVVSSDNPGYLSATPGAVFLYLVAAVLLLLPYGYWTSGQVSRWIRRGLGVVWLAWAVVQAAIPSYWSGTTLMSAYANAGALSQPTWMSQPIISYSLWLEQHAVAGNLILSVIMAGLGIASLSFEWNRFVLAISLLFLFWTWWFVEDFGAVFSGLTTDLNIAPILGLMVVCGYLMRPTRRE